VADVRQQRGRARDQRGRAGDARAAALAQAASDSEVSFIRQLGELATQAQADRAGASADRARAEQDRTDAEADRAAAAGELARVENELRSAHFDDLTGVYRRDVGRLALAHEIDRSRRSDGRFVLAFIDVDGLKVVNDRDGHAAGDRVLENVVSEIRHRLRSYDVVVRYGGDEFVCGIAATDLADTQHRFDTINAAIEAGSGAGISVGLAALGEGETLDELIERADAGMLEVKKERRVGR
jgi:diguanylate cyclase (GGDEF)-like protein